MATSYTPKKYDTRNKLETKKVENKLGCENKLDF